MTAQVNLPGNNSPARFFSAHSVILPGFIYILKKKKTNITFVM